MKFIRIIMLTIILSGFAACSTLDGGKAIEHSHEHAHDGTFGTVDVVR